MAPTIQKALVIPAEKEPFKLVDDWPVPRPGPTDVLVKLVSVVLNPVDAYVQASGDPQGLVPGYPYVSGFDASGVVEEVGAEVTNVAKGDRVLVQGTFNNLHMTFEEYTLQPAKYVAKIPSNITFDQPATVSLCLATVVNGIWGHEDSSNSVRFTPPWEEGGTTAYVGQAALILGGGTNVGQYDTGPAIQCARMQGFSPIITTASPKTSALLKSLGATHVLDRALAPSALRAAPPPLNLAGSQAPITNASRVCARAMCFPGNVELGAEIFKSVTAWLKTGVNVPCRVEVIPGGLAGIAAGCERMLGWDVGAKLVVHVDETP